MKTDLLILLNLFSIKKEEEIDLISQIVGFLCILTAMAQNPK